MYNLFIKIDSRDPSLTSAQYQSPCASIVFLMMGNQVSSTYLEDNHTVSSVSRALSISDESEKH